MRPNKLVPRILVVVLFALPGICGVSAQTAVPTPASVTPAAAKYLRTELYFGRSIADGSLVSDSDWERFVEEVIATRFPDGFTVVDAVGQYRGSNGRVVKEMTKMLILFYPKSQKRPANLKADDIRREYMRRFRQESVLRVDTAKPVLVSF